MADDFTFQFIEFNPRRAARGARAARVEVNGNWVWMSVEDLKKNVAIFGPLAAFTEAIEAYKNKGDAPTEQRRYVCERCGDSGVQPAGCWTGKAYDSLAGQCELCAEPPSIS